MLALCREHRLEHRTKHIALRYFLARELQQRGQLRLAYVASEANTADIFTKALAPGDHQRFCTLLGLHQQGGVGRAAGSSHPPLPHLPPPTAEAAEGKGGAALAAAHAGAGDGRWCWRTQPCVGAHGRTRLRAAMRARTQLRAAAAVFVTERSGAGPDGAGRAGRVTGRRSNGAVRAAQLVAMTAESLPSSPSHQSQLRARRAPRN
ncbi:unnamed protein product [Closterium sp. NIES-54]